MSDFHSFAVAVRKSVAVLLRNTKLFVVDVDPDKLYDLYLASFPKGTNEVYRTRTEHDCSCCKAFIRNLGVVVAIKNGEMVTLWDMADLGSTYQPVADAMAAFLRAGKVKDIFLTSLNPIGQEKSVENKPGQELRTWEHFHAAIPRHFVNKDPGTAMNSARTAFSVLKRGVEELTTKSIETVLDLINQKALYRGEEFKGQLLAFQALQNNLKGGNELAIWDSYDAPVARLRNTAIGTLLQELSASDDVERAVRSFERIMAPANYKRPTAIVTAGMAEAALKTIIELDLEPALARRHARLSDVSVGSVLWVDNAVKGRMKGGIADVLMAGVKQPDFDPNKAKPITLDAFLAMRHNQGVKLYFDNPLIPHLVSMTAPVHPEVKRLFRWDNDFAWSYNGDMADSIKERVKQAGGQVEGVSLRCSLAWFNFDDLDLHCDSPMGHLDFRNARPHILDVDMNAGGAKSRNAVENMRWKAPPDGTYRFSVHNYSRRETVDVGFEIEVESALGVHSFRHTAMVPSGAIVQVCTVNVRHGQVSSVTSSGSVIAGRASQEAWGLKTLNLVPVQTIIQSPNHWDDNAVGNKHWFFILEGCKNPEPCRGIYNEFLHPRLEPHRKAFEMLGSRSKCPVADEQLSGVGFSSTRSDKVVVVSGGVPYAIQF